MPISADIYSGYLEPVKFATLGEIAAQRDQRKTNQLNRQIAEFNLSAKQREQADAEKAAQAKAQEDALIAQTFQKHMGPDGPDRKAIVRDLYQVSPAAAQRIEASFTKLLKDASDARKVELDNENAEAKQLSQYLQGVRPETYRPVLSVISRISPDAAQFLGTEYDPAKIQTLLNAGTERSEYNKSYKDILDRNESDEKKTLGLLAIAKDQEHWQDALDFAKLHGVLENVAGMGFGPWTPDAPQRAANYLMGPEKVATIDEQKADNARQDRQFGQSLAIQQGNLDVARGNLRVRQQEANKPQGSTSGGGRNVTSGDANRLSEITQSIKQATDLMGVVDKTGTPSAVGAMMPDWVTNMTGWGSNAKARQASIDLVKQIIGKGLEGGVLRKEDEIKYAKILPTISDAPPVARAKVTQLIQALKDKQDAQLSALEDAGYNTSRFRERDAGNNNSSGGNKAKVGKYEVEW